MNKLFILTGLLFAMIIGTELKAQSKSISLHHQQTMDVLGLTPEQQSQIKVLTRQSFADIREIRQDSTLSEYEMKTKRSNVYRKRDADYKKVLTEEQWKKLSDMREELKKDN